MTPSRSPVLLTLGYAKRSIGEAIDLLTEHEIRFLVDVRSAPYSRYHPDFSHDALKRQLESHDLVYLFLGEELVTLTHLGIGDGSGRLLPAAIGSDHGVRGEG